VKIKRCPVCKSLEIDWFMGGWTGNYTCKDCKYVGTFVIEEDIGKILKFHPSLISSILDKSKTTTWRLFDDKNLMKGDKLLLINSKILKDFAKAEILDVKKTKFKDLNEEDWKGHEKFENNEKMFEAYAKYYGRKVNKNTSLKIIKFKIINK
jgi:hypothetical protein